MAIKLYQGKTKFMYFPAITSETHNANSLVTWDEAGTVGFLTGATAGSIGHHIAGVLRHAVATTDADYAVARLIGVEVPVEKNVVWECDVTTAAALTSKDMGQFH